MVCGSVLLCCVTSATQCCVMWAVGGGPWALGLGLWAVGCGPCVVICAWWCVVYGMWSVVFGLWSVACGLWSVVCGLWSMIRGLWSVVCRVWFVVCGWWSVVGGTHVFWLLRKRSYNLFRRRPGNVLEFLCVPYWNVATTTHDNATRTSSRGGRQIVFLALVALINSEKMVCGLLVLVCGSSYVVCGLWLGVSC